MTEPTIDGVHISAAIAPGRWRAEYGGAEVEARTIDPALAPIYAEMRGGSGQCTVLASSESAVVIAPLAPETLAQVSGPLPVKAVAFVAARLATALATLPCEASLSLEDVGLDASGYPVFAPTGAPPASPKGGLGPLLVQLSTGRPYDGDLTRLPPALAPAIRALIADPSDLSPIASLAALASPVDLRLSIGRTGSLKPATLTAGEVKLTVAAPQQRRAARDVREPVAGVVVRAEVLASLPPAALSALAGALELPLTEIRDAQREGRPLVVEPLYNTKLLNTATLQQQRALEVPLAGVKGPGVGRVIEVGFFGAVSAAATLAAAVTGSGGVALVGLVAAALGVVSIVGGVRTARDKRALVAAYLHQEGARDESPPWLADIAARRKALANADLPEPVERDARGVLDSLEAATDPAEVTQGLLALDPLLRADSPAGSPAERAQRIAALAQRANAETR